MGSHLPDTARMNLELFKRERFDLIGYYDAGINKERKLSSKQCEAMAELTNGNTFFTGYGGSAFSGKSWLLSWWEMLSSLAYPGTGWGLCRKELVTLKKTTLLTLYKVLAGNGMRLDTHFKVNNQLNVITFIEEKSDIFLIDTKWKPSDPLYTTLGGYELTGAAIDESNETPIKAIEILFTRTGRRKNEEYGLTRKMFETFNPDKNHVYSRYYKPYRDGEERNRYKFIPALPTDNPSEEAKQYVKDTIEAADKITIERLIRGNFDYDDDPRALIDSDKIYDLFNNSHVQEGTDRYISADIALEGSDELKIGVWYGWVVVERVVMAKSRSDEVVQVITALKNKHKVPNSQIVYDADGVGAFIGGWVKGAIAFKNGSRPLPPKGAGKEPENYENLKAQCTYKYAEKCNRGEIWLKAIVDKDEQDKCFEDHSQMKRKSMISEKKLGITSKKEIRENIGRSPDDGDMCIMRMIFELKPKKLGARAI